MQDKKYELAERTITSEGRTLFRIKALRDFAGVKADELGGLIEGEHNLSQEDNAWVSDEAKVYGKAWVSGDARISGKAYVYGEALVYGKARVYDEAEIHGKARVYGDAGISGKAEIYDNARIYGNAQVFGEKKVKDYERFFEGNVS